MTLKASEPLGFAEITQLITAARVRAVQAVNTTLIDLYWQVGQIISQRIAQAQWGDGVVAQLAAHLAQAQPGLRGFTRVNLFRMRQFYEAYKDDVKVSAPLRLLPWTHNLIILNQSKRPEEREFYLRLAVQEKWSSRELERQFKGRNKDEQSIACVGCGRRWLHRQPHGVAIGPVGRVGGGVGRPVQRPCRRSVV